MRLSSSIISNEACESLCRECRALGIVSKGVATSNGRTVSGCGYADVPLTGVFEARARLNLTHDETEDLITDEEFQVFVANRLQPAVERIAERIAAQAAGRSLLFYALPISPAVRMSSRTTDPELGFSIRLQGEMLDVAFTLA